MSYTHLSLVCSRTSLIPPNVSDDEKHRVQKHTNANETSIGHIAETKVYPKISFVHLSRFGMISPPHELNRYLRCRPKESQGTTRAAEQRVGIRRKSHLCNLAMRKYTCYRTARQTRFPGYGCAVSSNKGLRLCQG